ncbi:hypothetical protein [Polyangium jinanense]|uniref:Lipoprotein n=1 Tax=Polyangium jinanense TaxID=2829994 RepID=A0A9X4AX87_9BACT|nr:hypothetical protein [Polyangium jinanense]MDC3957419.1 hypothetical protein [Polyangium jinanense]MDC3988193.1 hypothetical protein [Polyangium jinanense]
MNDMHSSQSSKYLGRLKRAASTLLIAAMPVLGLGVVAGCAWTPTNLRVDPAFTSKELVTGRIAIMPVKFDTTHVGPRERSLVVAQFIRATRQNRQDIPIVSNAEHDQALQGALQEEAKYLRVYEEGGTDPSRLAELKTSLNARYFVLARLHYEQVVHGAGSMGGNAVESTLSGKVSIVDTTSGAIVWEGEFSSTRSGVDTQVDPHPSAHGLPFFSTFVRAWPKQP